MANLFYPVGYDVEKIHSGMIAYLSDLWNEGEREPLDTFLGQSRRTPTGGCDITV
jgi:hypothetical protein